MNSFADFMVKLAPGWLIETHTGQQYQLGKGEAFDELTGLYSDAVTARFIASADAEALYLIGSERGITLYPEESLEAYRRRVQGAWEFWRWAGTNTGILIALRQMGYDARIIEHFRTSPDEWADFSIDFMPIDITPSLSKYDDVNSVYDQAGTTYDVQMRVTEIDRVRSVVNHVKAAQSRLRRLTFVLAFPDRYDDSGTVYDDPETIYTADDAYQAEL